MALVVPCPICLVPGIRQLAEHVEFHRVNDQHKADCAWLRTKIAQRGTGAYLVPGECRCYEPSGQPDFSKAIEGMPLEAFSQRRDDQGPSTDSSTASDSSST